MIHAMFHAMIHVMHHAMLHAISHVMPCVMFLGLNKKWRFRQSPISNNGGQAMIEVSLWVIIFGFLFLIFLKFSLAEKNRLWRPLLSTLYSVE